MELITVYLSESLFSSTTSSVFNSVENTGLQIPQIGIYLTMAGNERNLQDFCSF